MIHDIDIVLTLTRSPVVKVDALGISVLGRHEDMATTRLTFSCGCIAQLTASRVSYDAKRLMHVFTTRSATTIDFAAGHAVVVQPREDVLRRKFRIDNVATDDVAYWKEHLFEELLVKTELHPAAVNAIEEEQRDLVASIREGRQPRVHGAVGRDAVAVAERILERIAEHTWDGHTSGRRGPFAMPALPILGGPEHWLNEKHPLRRAG